MDLAPSYHPPDGIRPRAAVDACLHFSDDRRIFVEPACGAALSTIYDRAQPLAGREPILVIVCGGVSLELLKARNNRVSH